MDSMAKRGQGSDVNVDSRFLRKEERRRARRLHQLIGCAAIVLGLLLLAFFAGDYTRGFLAYFGLEPFSNRKTGLYADCSRPENRGIGFCEGRGADSERRWRSLERREKAPFQIE